MTRFLPCSFNLTGDFAMRLTSKGRYAVTAMLDVALHSHKGPVPLADISERQGISLSYLEQLFSRLRTSVRPLIRTAMDTLK